MDKPRILIVEDDTDVSDMLTDFFRVQDYDVMTAAWGSDALRISREELVHLIVLDIHLPDIDGYEICRQLRSTRQTQDIPVIFLTEKRDRVDRLEGLKLGVVDYITKPFDTHELLLRVRNAISRAAQQHVTNAVTELPNGAPVEENLKALLQSDEAWAALVLALSGLNEFRELYGFVAADDVVRAVALMIRNAVNELGREEDFIGHLAAADFIVMTTPDAAVSIRERLATRFQQSREYFYPLSDRQAVRESVEADTLNLWSALIDSSAGPLRSLQDFFDALGYVPRA